MHSRFVVLLTLMALACGDDASTSDAAVMDASVDASSDAMATDGGTDVEEDTSEPDVPLDGATNDVPTIDAGPSSSGGSGGITCESTGRVSGLDYCVVTVSGVEMKIIEPEDMSGPLHLAIYLHGDGARAYDNDTAPRIQAPWAHSRRTLYVAARAPNRCAWWLRPEYSACDGSDTDANLDVDGANAAALSDAIEALQEGWDISFDPILLGGSSGGSVFLTGSFLPLEGDRFRGAYALGCGGFEPFAEFDWEPTRMNQGSTFLYFSYGDMDEYRGEIEDGIDAYRMLDFALDVDLREGGVAHCAFDHIGWVSETWDAYLDSF